MTEQFKDQGGAATMDPNPVARWFLSRVMSRLFKPASVDKRRAAFEKARVKSGEPNRVEYFHQVEDGYSHLAAQVLARFAERYDVELLCHLVEGPQGKNVPEPELLLNLSRYDAFHVAPDYGLEFPQHPAPCNPELAQQAAGILAHQDTAGFVACAADVGSALWTDDAEAMTSLAGKLGVSSPAEAEASIRSGSEHRDRLKHYSGAMFYFADEWYWGVDRLYHLEKRLAAMGLDRQPGQAMIMPRPEVEEGEMKDNGSLTLEVYPSLRSPYTSIVFDRTLELARQTGVKLVVKPVLPMVMRGVPATREKGLYIFMDTAREAREAGVPYGNVYDPIGDPVRRCYSLYPWAVEQGRGNELLSSFLSAAFAQGINTNSSRGLRKVVEAAGLDWGEAQEHLGCSGWEDILEANRLAMYEAGLWGVPSFRLLNAEGEQVLALWGQDRLWLFAREIQRQLAA